MSKVKVAALLRDITRLAAAIHRKNPNLGGAGKKELSFIHKHLRKAAKAIERNAGKAKPARKGKKRSPPPRARRPRTAQEAPVKTRQPSRAQGTL